MQEPTELSEAEQVRIRQAVKAQYQREIRKRVGIMFLSAVLTGALIYQVIMLLT